MKKAKCIIGGMCMVLLFTSCGPIIKRAVNKKYPPVSSIQKSAESVKNSIAELEKIAKIDLGIRLDQLFLDSLLSVYFNSLHSADRTLGIPSVDNIEIIKHPAFSIGKQEIIVTTELKFFITGNKYVKDISIEFSGRLSPYMNEDTLHLAPSFERVRITKLKLKKCLFLGAAAKAGVNILCKNFMDNINGQIKTFAVKINYPPFPEVPLSTLIGVDENVSVTNDYTFKLRRKTLHPVILLKPGSLTILAAIDETGSAGGKNLKAQQSLTLPPQPNYLLKDNTELVLNKSSDNSKSSSGGTTGNTAEIIPIATITTTSITNSDFEQLFDHFDSSFIKSWNNNLDVMPDASSSNNSARISYDALSRITNELLKDAQFGINYTINTKSDFPEKQITLGEIGKPDCDAITFDCQFNNCSNVLSDCGSCSWYDVPCHARWSACQVFNGAKYAACQTSNAAKAVWCAGELAVRKTLCYAEIAAIFIYDNLIKDIGKFSGNATANGTIIGNITKTEPGGISYLTLSGTLNADINARVQLRFKPSGLIGHLICTFPFDETFSLDHIRVNNQPIKLRADIERLNAPDVCVLKINFQKTSIPIQLSEPLLVELLKKPLLVLNCGIGIGLGITVTAVLALKGNESFKNYLRAALFGSYRFDFEKSFDVKIPAIPVSIGSAPVLLYPTWGEKSILFTKK